MRIENLQNSAKAFSILRDSYAKSFNDPRTQSLVVDAKFIAEDDGWFGIVIRDNNLTKTGAQSLKPIVGLGLHDLAWFGYQTAFDGKYVRAVWFYCASPKLAMRLLQHLEQRLLNCTLEPKSNQIIVLARTPFDESDFDQNWFCQVFLTALALKPVLDSSE